jgi:hypothetical protein
MMAKYASAIKKAASGTRKHLAGTKRTDKRYDD